MAMAGAVSMVMLFLVIGVAITVMVVVVMLVVVSVSGCMLVVMYRVMAMFVCLPDLPTLFSLVSLVTAAECHSGILASLSVVVCPCGAAFLPGCMDATVR